MHGQGNLELFLIFLLAAVVAVPLFRRFGLGAVLGYLFAGLLMGPFGLRVVKDPAAVLSFSELGVVMLLFVIGLELSPSRSGTKAFVGIVTNILTTYKFWSRMH